MNAANVGVGSSEYFNHCQNMPFPRSQKRHLDDYKLLLRIAPDYGGTGIWEIREPKARHAGSWVSYESLGIPKEFIERFNYWTSWYDSYESWNGSPEPDDELFSAYEFALAIDLKRFLGNDYYVECRGREIHDDREYLRAAKD